MRATAVADMTASCVRLFVRLFPVPRRAIPATRAIFPPLLTA